MEHGSTSEPYIIGIEHARTLSFRILAARSASEPVDVVTGRGEAGVSGKGSPSLGYPRNSAGHRRPGSAPPSAHAAAASENSFFRFLRTTLTGGNPVADASPPVVGEVAAQSYISAGGAPRHVLGFTCQRSTRMAPFTGATAGAFTPGAGDGATQENLDPPATAASDQPAERPPPAGWFGRPALGAEVGGHKHLGRTRWQASLANTFPRHPAATPTATAVLHPRRRGCRAWRSPTPRPRARPLRSPGPS